MLAYHLKNNRKAKRRYKWFRHSMKLFNLWFVSNSLKKHEYIEYTFAFMVYQMQLSESIFWLKYQLSKFALESPSVIAEYGIKDKQITTEYLQYHEPSQEDSKVEDDIENYKRYDDDSNEEQCFDSCNIEMN
jgi:hypothetical protein